MSMSSSSRNIDSIRQSMRESWLADERQAVLRLIEVMDFDAQTRARIEHQAVELVGEMRRAKQPGVMEIFLAEYGLSTREGIALMCMAEALLRVPDNLTIDALIQDKIAPADWSQHLGHSGSPLVNASTWALLLTGKVISEEDATSWDLVSTMRQMIKRVGDPVIRTAVAQSMRVLGHQFVLGRTINEAVQRAENLQAKGYSYSYDMLGEAARTEEDARQYFLSYSSAIMALSEHCSGSDVRSNPGISVKLSALHERYEFNQAEHCVPELVSRICSLALLAKNAGMGFNIDAEEANRLDISLDIIEAVLANPDLKGWRGFGVVVQAYSPRALYVIDWLYAIAERLDRKIMVRLVKGAYWDTEIKVAQEQGFSGYPVFTRKLNTDISYLACARRLFQLTDRIYPQFATHNAHSVAGVLELAGDFDDFEFQRLHGMGELLHELLRKSVGKRCRIYAPVGVHEDLLAYLVRRLLENGANSSFVNQVLDESVPATLLVRDPVDQCSALDQIPNPFITVPAQLFAPQRQNSSGWNLANPLVLAKLTTARAEFQTSQWSAGPMLGAVTIKGQTTQITNPANRDDVVGDVIETTPEQCREALDIALTANTRWRSRAASERGDCLLRIADLYEQHAPELIALVCREAGKTVFDGISEVREAVDFCRYYSTQIAHVSGPGRGVFVCISPWNFPLAIFTGQIAAALVTGNSVIAKPAEQTPLIAARAVTLMHQAGIPVEVLQLLPGDGPSVGALLVGDSRIAGVCFTGSTQTAQAIHRAMAATGNPRAPLIAETGGLNAMIVDSSALPEQAVRDIVVSAFQSAGQRCSALRVLCVQEDVADRILEMLKGAMDALRIGDPWDLDTDVGPVIDAPARDDIEQHCAAFESQCIHQLEVPNTLAQRGCFVAPAAFALDGIDQLEREIFGPVLHVVRYSASQLEALVDTINARNFGLTLGIHTRVDNRVQMICDRARVGNIYVNRNQIGAAVGSQPFGGEGLSGTGPKAGGPHYLHRFVSDGGEQPLLQSSVDGRLENNTDVDAFNQRLKAAAQLQPEWSRHPQRAQVLRKALAHCSPEVTKSVQQVLDVLPEFSPEPVDLPGPTGESNRLSVHGRGVFLCTSAGLAGIALTSAALLAGNALVLEGGDGADSTQKEFVQALIKSGLEPGLIQFFPGRVSLEGIRQAKALAGVLHQLGDPGEREIRQALADRSGLIASIISDAADYTALCIERSLCIDTTASGGNAQLLASAGGPE